jgi:hypothetical protein
MFIATLMGLLGMLLLNFLPTLALNLVLSPTSGARVYSEPYLKIRALTFIPALLSVKLEYCIIFKIVFCIIHLLLNK